MAKKLYEETNIQAIANAIREKNGISATYKVSEMADAILAISGGETVDTPGAILPPASSWTFSKVLEHVDAYTIDQCAFSGDVFVGSVTGANKGAGIRSNSKIDLTDAQYLHIEFTAVGISSNNNQFCVYAKNGIGTNGTEVVLDKVATEDEIAAGYMDIDVSAITGSYYLFMGLVRWGGGNAVAAISKVTLKGGTTA